MITKSVKPKLRYALRGMFGISIPYEIRNTKGDWSPYFGTYEGQKKENFDTNCCWAYAMNECIEDQLEFLWKENYLSVEVKKWFKDNGYIDADGDFYLSRRFIPIMSGVANTGNDESEAWRLTKKYGAIPNSVLPYTNNLEYFDRNKVTPAMLALGQEFLKRIKVEYQEVGIRFTRKDIKMIEAALKQSELQIGIPIPQDTYLWNFSKIKWDGGTQASHSIALYKIDEITDPQYPYYVYDQYNPSLKQLSKDYLIPIVTQGIVTAIPQPTVPVTPLPVNPVSQTTLGALIWRAIVDFFQRNPWWTKSGDPVV